MLKTVRVVVALFFFIAILIAFSDVKGLLPAAYYKAVLYLQFVPSVVNFLTPGALFTLGFLIVIALTLFLGRVYCSTICPLGILQDAVIFLKRKIFPNQKLRYKKALTMLRYSCLAGVVASLLISGIMLVNLLDPYANFGRMATYIFQPILLWGNNLVANTFPAIGLYPVVTSSWHIPVFVFSLSVFLLVLILSWSRGRLYCNAICPVGTLLGLISKTSIYKVKISRTSCTQCGQCQSVCKANCINIKRMEIDESRCVACYNCISSCKENAVGYLRKRKDHSEQKATTDTSRRLFLALVMGYMFYKTTPLKAQPKRNRVRRGPGYYRQAISFFERGTIAPPGSISIKHLKSACVGCNLCISACPTKVLQPAFLEYGVTGMMMPRMDYSVHFCNYDCTKCGEVCPTGAIVRLTKEDKQLTQIGKVQFKKHHCIVASEGTSCGSCSEHCPTQAVKMVPYTNGLTIPQIDPSICIGCGACEYACPVIKPHKAIFVASNEVHQKAEKPVSEKIEYQETEDFPF